MYSSLTLLSEIGKREGVYSSLTLLSERGKREENGFPHPRYGKRGVIDQLSFIYTSLPTIDREREENVFPFLSSPLSSPLLYGK